MKTIQISQIKDEDFQPIDLIEKTIFIDKKNAQNTLSGIKEVMLDIEGLREALFFKQEKLKIQLRNTKEKLEEDKILEVHKKVRGLKLESLGDTKEILQRNKEIFELKIINKVLKYTIEVKKGNYNILTSLIKSEDKDDWKFLCFYINNTIEIFDNEIKDKMLEISKNIQERLISVFEEAKKINNKTIMQSAYIALEELDKNNTLLQTYIYDMEIFKKIYNMSHPSFDDLDIELYDEENNTFLFFINDVKMSYQEHFVDISEIFTNYEEAYKIINRKIFYDLIFPNLENFLQGTIPFVFLFSIENAYKNIYQLGIFIESVCSNFDCKNILDEISYKYSALCIDKERSFFKEIFNKLVYGNSTQVKYVLKNEPITFSKDYNQIINILLILIDLFFIRSKLFYNEEDISDMFLFYGEYFTKLINVISEDITNKIETICQIQKITNKIQKYFKDEYYKLGKFIKKNEELINSSLKWKIDQSEIRIKQLTTNILFYRPESDILILDFLKDQIFESKKIKGKIQKDYVEDLFLLIYGFLKQRIFNLRFSISQKKNLKDFFDRFMHSVLLTGSFKVIDKYKYLENIIIIIVCDKINIKDVYENLKLKISKEDMKMAIKCRNDKPPIQFK